MLATVHGVPAIYGTYLRPDSAHTSYVAGIASMDQRLVSFQLRPGAEDPGPGNWGFAPWLPPGSRIGLLATFNGGFKLDVADGGFYLNGITKGTLNAGAASLVYYKNGQVAIGAWDHGVSTSPAVLGVRQNLKLIVVHGAIPASVNQNVESQWGAPLGGGHYVWRSGIGITRDGRVIFAYGPALSVSTLAGLLQRARGDGGHAIGHQPRLDVLHVLQASPQHLRPDPGEPPAHSARARGPLLLGQQPRLHRSLQPVTGHASPQWRPQAEHAIRAISPGFTRSVSYSIRTGVHTTGLHGPFTVAPHPGQMPR